MTSSTLIIQFSTLGNMAMTVPVIATLSRLHPDHTFVILGRRDIGDLFQGMDNVYFHRADTDNGTIKSHLRLWRELSAYSIHKVVDFQDTLRTRILRMLWRFRTCPVHVISSVRTERQRLLLRGYKHSEAIASHFTRMTKTLNKAGFHIDIRFSALPIHKEAYAEIIRRFGSPSGKWIGIAPFATSPSNMLSKRTIKEVIAYWSQQSDTRVYLFGAGRIESAMLSQWASVFPNVVSVAGQLSLTEELELMRLLKLMVCMDSANQHLSALVALPTLTIWCATHPYMGYQAWHQQSDNIIQRPLACRPCTVHGCRRCKYNNFACQRISSADIIDKMNQILKS